LAVTLSQLFFWGVPIVSVTSYLCLLFIFIVSRKDRAMRAYLLMLTAMVIWSGGSLLMKLEAYPGVLFWNKVMVSGLFLSPLYVYFLLTIVSTSKSRKGFVFWSVVMVGLFAVNWMGLIVTDARLVRVPVMVGTQLTHDIHLIYAIGPAGVASYAVVALLVFDIFRKAGVFVRQGEAELSRVRPVVLAAAIVFIGNFANLLPELGRHPIDLLCGFISALVMFYAIFKHRMFEMRFLLTRGMVYSLFVALITALYVYAVYLMERYLSVFRSMMPYLMTFAALLAALMFQPLFALTHRIVDMMFYKSTYNQRNALRTFNVNIANNLNLAEISTQLLEAVEQAIRAKRSSLLLRDEETGCYKVFSTTVQLNLMDMEIPSESPIVRWFNQNDGCLTRDLIASHPLFHGLWDSEKKTIADLDVQVVVPVKCRGALIGMVLLSSKEVNSSYTLDDLELLNSFGASTAIAVENARLYHRVQQEATTDELTGLYNTRYLYQYLPTVIVPKSDTPVSIIIIDVDLFKLYNDLYGHFEGDSALRRIGLIIRAAVGQAGVCARYGGEEFAIVLPYYDSQRSLAVAEKIRTEVQRAFFGDDSQSRRFLTVSSGICTYPAAAPNQDELLTRADLALYSAKNSGKNRTVIYTPNLAPDQGAADAPQGDVSSLGISGNPSYAATLFALMAAIDTKDHFTFSHSQKVARYAQALATELGMDPRHVAIIGEAGLLHDIGKIGISENILAKPGRLSSAEYEVMKQHVEMSITIVKHLPSLNYVTPAILGHHERWDGKGYPRGLKGEEIPLSARCLAVADCFDAIVSGRPYKKGLPLDFALAELERGYGTQFDPEVARTFVRMVREGTMEVSLVSEFFPEGEPISV
jgi:diguanylate cyclase (GGDEF)-like protein/putative nucleotidyltransferase with HDIG domain